MSRLALRRDRRGIATTEFALIAPLLITFIAGLMEFSYVGFARASLESATMKGARKVAASDCPAQRQGLLTDTIESAMKEVASSDGQKPQIETKSYGSSFGDVGEPEPFPDNDGDNIDEPGENNGQYDPGEPFTDVNGNGQWDKDMGSSGSIGGAGQIVSYTATFKVKSLLPFIARQFAGQDHYAIKATTVIRNEPVFRTTGCPS